MNLPHRDGRIEATLPLHAQSHYTTGMWPRALTFSPIVLLCAALLNAQQAPPREPRELLATLNRVQVDPAAVYKRGDAKLLFEEGYLGFFTSLGGHVTGAVFSGRGHILAIPRDPVEKQQLARFLGAPVIDQDFSSAYLRFTDDTESELRGDLQSAHIEPQTNNAFTGGWQAAVLSRNSAHSFRILAESYSQTPHPYFTATLGGVSQGSFDFVYDLEREEPQLFGQVRKVGGLDYYDVWSSYCPPGIRAPTAAFRALSYRIETTVHPDNSISGVSVVHVRAAQSGERLIPFQFSRLLNVEAVTAGTEPLFSFPDNSTTREERAASGNDLLYVLLPRPASAGDDIELTIRYHGNVIRNAGNGVLFVGSRESWYPHLGDTASFSSYDLTFHWPRKLRLAATGTKIDEREDGDTRTGHWKTERPASVAGFNLGEYAFASLADNGYSVDVYANRQLEQALLNRLRQPEMDDLSSAISGPIGAQRHDHLRLQMPPPSPADALKALAREIDSSIHFYENLSGPAPFPLKLNSARVFPKAARNISMTWFHFTKWLISGGATWLAGPAIAISGLTKDWRTTWRFFLRTARKSPSTNSGCGWTATESGLWRKTLWKPRPPRSAAWTLVFALTLRTIRKVLICWSMERVPGFFTCCAKCCANLPRKIPTPALFRFCTPCRPNTRIARFPATICNVKSNW